MITPTVKQLKPRPFPDFEDIHLANGARIIAIDEPDWKVFRLEACFLAGRPFETKPGAAKSTADLLREGSRQYSALTLAEHFEMNGASIHSKCGIDTAHVLMHGPSEKFEDLFPVFHELVTSPSFSKKELSKFKRREKERLIADLSINEVVAYRKLTEGLFGAEHPYGYNSVPETYQAIEKEDLIEHHRKTYGPNTSLFILSGGINNKMVEAIKVKLGSWKGGTISRQAPQRIAKARKGVELYESGTQYQASIKMGKLLFSYEHEDYPYGQIANTLLGGYFGSRLMKRVRSERGLSYHIYSALEPMLFDGYWMIATETSMSNVDAVIELIHEEMARLAEERIRPREMKMMRNYMIGNSLQFFEGAFNKSDFLRHQLFEVGKAQVYDPMMAAIMEMDAGKIREVAEKHFRPDELLTVVVK